VTTSAIDAVAVVLSATGITVDSLPCIAIPVGDHRCPIHLSRGVPGLDAGG